MRFRVVHWEPSSSISLVIVIVMNLLCAQKYVYLNESWCIGDWITSINCIETRSFLDTISDAQKKLYFPKRVKIFQRYISVIDEGD